MDQNIENLKISVQNLYNVLSTIEEHYSQVPITQTLTNSDRAFMKSELYLIVQELQRILDQVDQLK